MAAAGNRRRHRGRRKVVKADGVIPPGTPIGRLGDVEWGWIAAAILFGWISTRPEQATAKSIDTERAIRMTALDTEPWDAGAITTVLPQLAETPGIDWAKPFGEWPRETMVQFLLAATRLIRKAMIARDTSERGITRDFERKRNRAPGQRCGWWTADDAERAQRPVKCHGLQSYHPLRRADQHRD